MLNAAVHYRLFEFHLLSSNLPSLSHFLSLCLSIFRPSIPFNVRSHLCHILLLPLYILFQFCISLSALLYMKCDSLTIGIGPCYPVRAYVFFDISSASKSVFTDVIFHFKTFFSKIEREEIWDKRQKFHRLYIQIHLLYHYCQLEIAQIIQI